MSLFACAALLLAGIAADSRIAEAAQALEAGRVEQARVMTSAAVRNGASGEQLERLLADLAAAQGRWSEALLRFQRLLVQRPDDAPLLEAAASAAWKVHRPDLATAYARRAAESDEASWRAWNILGVAADAERDWASADEAYSRAMALAPGQAELLNNQGWSQMLRGDWNAALALFERASAADPSRSTVANNLALARAALAGRLPVRRSGESADEWAARLNDAGVAAHMRGECRRAVAAFTRAIEIRSRWNQTAAENLRAAQCTN